MGMPQRVSYNTIYKDGKEILRTSSACYSSIFGYLDTISKIENYFLKRDLKRYKDTVLSEDEMREYFNILEKMGFKFTVNFDSFYPIKGDENPSEAIKVTFSVEEHSIISSKVFLNALRYTHEESYPLIAKSLIALCKEEHEEVNLFSKFLLSHLSTPSGGGHTFLNSTYYPKILTDKEVQELIFENNEQVRVDGLALRTGVSNTNYYKKEDAFFTLTNFQTKDFSEIFKKYQEICGKYI